MALTKVQRIMTQPINLIFRFLQSKARIQIWLFEQKDLRIEGRIIMWDSMIAKVRKEIYKWERKQPDEESNLYLVIHKILVDR
ncbi:uncharacterized protein LOC133922758 isoform X4 [Phragmites australis]|uniref:uncharacterized protein LOC133922758 isoform X4 n=1 Tax=Phragmites australis TaxID=29695 RepID=UPI002D7847E2|nr:uncharacterized protein LOC133922758 isoform X4 [Phragmites australis]